MKRKVVRIGPSTMMVSLPSQWVKQNNISPGEELEAHLKPKEIIFSRGEYKPQQKEIILDVTLFNTFLLVRYLEMLYLNNYHKIVLVHSRQDIEDEKNQRKLNVRNFIKYLSTRLIGMEIVFQTVNMTELYCLISEKDDELDKIERRIYYLIKESFQELLASIDKDFSKFCHIAYDHHDNIVKFILYYLRTLDQSDKSIGEKKALYSLYLLIDKQIDQFRHICDVINQLGCTFKIKNLLKEIIEFNYEMFSMLQRGKVSNELITKKYLLIQKIDKTKYTKEEVKIILEAKFLVMILNDFVRTIIIRNIVVKT